MEVPRFADLQPEFLARVDRAVYASLATVDRRGRPRSRVMHPVWDGPIGWIISSPSSHKARHLAANPAVSLAYLHDPLKPVYVDAYAAWVHDPAEKRRIWDLHRDTPAPLGFDPAPHYGTIDNPLYGLLRLQPWRIELGDLYGEALVWHPAP
jgi:general stress protein 26